MFRDWKISTFNGVLIASYFIPAWITPTLQIAISPVHGLYSQPGNVAAAMFASDYLQLGAAATIRFGWLLALAKFTVVAFFAVFLVNALRTRTRRDSDESMGIALILGTIVSFTSMLLASKVGELHAVRLHATETLLLLSIGILIMVEGVRFEAKSKVESDIKDDNRTVDQAARRPAAPYPQAQPSAMTSAIS